VTTVDYNCVHFICKVSLLYLAKFKKVIVACNVTDSITKTFYVVVHV